jgi:predicted lipid-binding transport protein (Tim44 family)
MRIALLVVAALALVAFVTISYVLPQREQAQARSAAQALISGAEAAKQQVAAAAQKSGSLAGSGKGVKIAPRNDPEHGDMKWVVAEDGAIRGWNEINALEVAITPALQAASVSWTCKGYPVSAMPGSCGGR